MKRISLSVLFLVSAIISLLVGVENVTFMQLLSPDELTSIILFTLRIPRTVSLLAAGAILSVSGLLMQQMTQNKFVSPTTAGTMSSARLGMILAMVFFGQHKVFHRTLFAFIFSIIGTLVFLQFLKTVKLRNSIMIPMVGLMFGNVVGAIGTFIAYQYDLIQNATAWLQGNVSLVSSQNYKLILLTVPLLILIYLFSQYFSVMNLGREQASGLGVAYQQIELIGIVIVSIATAAVLLTVGNIPFIGLVVPNLLSLRYGDHFRKLLFPTAYFGALFLLWSDIFSRIVIYPYEVPVSLVVGVVGTALFLFLLLKGEKA